MLLIILPTAMVYAEDAPAQEALTATEETTAVPAPEAEATANQVWPMAPETDSASVFVIESSSSIPLYEKEVDTQRYPASTTKILTALLAIENCSLDEIVTFSENAVNLEYMASNIKAVAGEQMPLRDVLYGLLLASGNDCGNAIAEHVAGSVSAFADMMNARAAELGCTSSHFVNPHGLFDPNHYTTARDLSLIAQAAFKNSTFLEISSTYEYYIPPTNMDSAPKKISNVNKLLDPETPYYNPEVICGKTGFLNESGRCLVTFSSRNGFNVITVQLKGAYDGIFAEANVLLDYVFNSFSMSGVSAYERRFAGASQKAKVVLDPSARILSLNAIPFEQLNSTLTFAEDLSVERKAQLVNDTDELSGRSLYAVIDYSYADHALGSANVYLDPELEVVSASFGRVFYIHPLFLIVFVLFVLVIALAIFNTNAKKKTAREKTARAPRSSSHSGEPPTRQRRR